MFRKVLFLAVIGLLFAAADLQADQVDVSWDGGGDGYSWGDPVNWDPNIVPDNDVNTFRVGINGASVVLCQNLTINQLGCSGDVHLVKSYGRVQLTLGVLTNYGELAIKEIDIHGNITNTAGARLNLIDVAIDGTLYNPAGGRIDIEERNHVNGVVENAGSITASPASELNVEGGNTFHNTGQLQLFNAFCVAGGLFHNDSNGVITGSGLAVSATSIQNDGEIYAYGGSLAVRSEGPLTNTGTLKNDVGATLHIQTSTADVNNQGIIEINVAGATVFDCNLVNKPNGVIELLGGTLSATTITQSADANFTGFGGITGDVFIDPNGLIELTGPTNIVGDVEIGPNATLEISDGTTLVTGHTTNNGTIHMKGGRIIPQGGFTNNGSIIWEPGTYNNIADFNLDGQVNFKDFADFADTWLWQAQL